MLITIIILKIGIIQVESTLGAGFGKQLRRTQSRSRSPSPSTSIASTVSHNVELESNPTAETSGLQQPLIEIERKSKQVRINSGSQSLVDPTVVTYSEHLDPRRDGVFARIRNKALKYGSAAVIGTAIGAVGGFAYAYDSIDNNTTNTSSHYLPVTQNVSKSQNNKTNKSSSYSTVNTESDVDNPL